MAQEAFEEFLASKHFYLNHLIEKGDFLLPIVHASADYFAPLRVGDRVLIELQLASLGTSSLTLKTTIWDEEQKRQLAAAQIVHVSVSKETGRSIPLPLSIKNIF